MYELVCHKAHCISVQVCGSGFLILLYSLCQIDVGDQASVEKANLFVAATVEDDGLNLLINNAGVISRLGIADVSREEMRRNYEINAIGPLMMAKVSIQDCGYKYIFYR